MDIVWDWMYSRWACYILSCKHRSTDKGETMSDKKGGVTLRGIPVVNSRMKTKICFNDNPQELLLLCEDKDVKEGVGG